MKKLTATINLVNEILGVAKSAAIGLNEIYIITINAAIAMFFFAIVISVPVFLFYFLLENLHHY